MSSSQLQWIPIAISPILLTAFILNEICLAKVPIIPISVLKSRGALLTCLAQLGFMAARWMVLFYTPVYAIAVRGWAPAAAGSMLIPTNLGFATGGLLVGWLHIRRAGSFYLYASHFHSLHLPFSSSSLSISRNTHLTSDITDHP
jgi:hypothetical protein